MDTGNTTYTKGKGGHRACTAFPLGDALDTMGRPGTRVLDITTYKFSGGLGTFASCHIEAGGMISFFIGGDFHKRAAQLNGARCTEKSVRELHTAVIDQQSSAILAEARAFYEAKDAAKALNAKRDAELKEADEKAAYSRAMDYGTVRPIPA